MPGTCCQLLEHTPDGSQSGKQALCGIHSQGKETSIYKATHTKQVSQHIGLAPSLLLLDGREGLIPLSVEAEGDVRQEVCTDYDDALVPDGLPYLEERETPISVRLLYLGKDSQLREIANGPERGWSKALKPGKLSIV
jgi:hypothetical protein